MINMKIGEMRYEIVANKKAKQNPIINNIFNVKSKMKFSL